MRELDAALLDGRDRLRGALGQGRARRSCPRASSSPPCRRAPTRATRCAAPPRWARWREGARVGTSSLRRAAQLRALRADLDVVELRGNVDTRLRKLADGDYDAIVLAAAGLQRLGRGDAGAPLDELVPAAGPGLPGA